MTKRGRPSTFCPEIAATICERPADARVGVMTRQDESIACGCQASSSRPKPSMAKRSGQEPDRARETVQRKRAALRLKPGLSEATTAAARSLP